MFLFLKVWNIQVFSFRRIFKFRPAMQKCKRGSIFRCIFQNCLLGVITISGSTHRHPEDIMIYNKKLINFWTQSLPFPFCHIVGLTFSYTRVVKISFQNPASFHALLVTMLSLEHEPKLCIMQFLLQLSTKYTIVPRHFKPPCFDVFLSASSS